MKTKTVGDGNFDFYGNEIIDNCEIVHIRHTKVTTEIPCLILVMFLYKMGFILSNSVEQNIFVLFFFFSTVEKK